MSLFFYILFQRLKFGHYILYNDIIIILYNGTISYSSLVHTSFIHLQIIFLVWTALGTSTWSSKLDHCLGTNNQNFYGVLHLVYLVSKKKRKWEIRIVQMKAFINPSMCYYYCYRYHDSQIRIDVSRCWVFGFNFTF